MDVRLRLLREDEPPDFAVEGKRAYADDMVANAGLSRGEADAKAERDYAQLLPDGLASEGQFIFVRLDGKGTQHRPRFSQSSDAVALSVFVGSVVAVRKL